MISMYHLKCTLISLISIKWYRNEMAEKNCRFNLFSWAKPLNHLLTNREMSIHQIKALNNSKYEVFGSFWFIKIKQLKRFQCFDKKVREYFQKVNKKILIVFFKVVFMLKATARRKKLIIWKSIYIINYLSFNFDCKILKQHLWAIKTRKRKVQPKQRLKFGFTEVFQERY